MEEMKLQRLVHPVATQRFGRTQRDLVHERHQGVRDVLGILLGKAGATRAFLQGLDKGAQTGMHSLGRGHGFIELAQAVDSAEAIAGQVRDDVHHAP
jgi:uncharacterized alpha-E superfamily protein